MKQIDKEKLTKECKICGGKVTVMDVFTMSLCRKPSHPVMTKGTTITAYCWKCGKMYTYDQFNKLNKKEGK